MWRGRLSVGAALGLLGVVEWYGIRHPGRGFTVSELLRWGFRTETRCGAALFAGAVAGGAGWLLPHILRGVEDVSAS